MLKKMFKKSYMQPADTTRRAIVLGGGGSKGAYQIGVWQAFQKLGISYHVVTGTSVGALNGALMAQGEFESALELWSNVDNSFVMNDIPSLDEKQADSVLDVYRAFVREIVRKGGVDVSPLENAIRSLLNEDKLRQSGIQYGIVTVDMKSLKPVEIFAHQIPEGMIADYMVASASCFPAFKPKEIGDKRYIDGGYHDVLPVELALRALPKVDEVYAIDIDGIGIKRKTRADVPVHIIRSYWELGNMLIFEKSVARRNIRLGYLDTLKAFGKLDGRAYAFTRGQKAELEERFLGEVAQICLGIFDVLPKVGRAQIEKLMELRLTDTLTNRRSKNQDYKDMLLTSAELAGELLGLDPTIEYTVDSFNNQLRKALERVQREDTPEEALERLKKLPITKLADGLKSVADGVLIQLCMEAMKQHVMGGESLFKPELMAMAVPKQMVASVYLLALGREAL